MKPINDSGAHILFICLSAPKQEKWMAAHTHKGRIKAVQLQHREKDIAYSSWLIAQKEQEK
ncbi:MAG: WecB/TagA/CpsF family glycosyltransferase [Nitrospirota bacterium]